MRRWSPLVGLLIALVSLRAATLEKLTFEEMVDKSTAIVRGRVTGTYAASRGSLTYTHYRVEVLERWKGSPLTEVDVVVPGGTVGGLRQHFSGTPHLSVGGEYVLFLWTGSRTGLTHIIGLTQGLFDLKSNAQGDTLATRAASVEIMLDRTTGHPVQDEAIRMRLPELSQQISRAMAAGARR